jgi:hypothetical protein
MCIPVFIFVFCFLTWNKAISTKFLHKGARKQDGGLHQSCMEQQKRQNYLKRTHFLCLKRKQMYVAKDSDVYNKIPVLVLTRNAEQKVEYCNYSNTER